MERIFQHVFLSFVYTFGEADILAVIPNNINNKKENVLRVLLNASSINIVTILLD